MKLFLSVSLLLLLEVNKKDEKHGCSYTGEEKHLILISAEWSLDIFLVPTRTSCLECGRWTFSGLLPRATHAVRLVTSCQNTGGNSPNVSYVTARQFRNT